MPKRVISTLCGSRRTWWRRRGRFCVPPVPRGRLLGRLRRIEGLDGLPTCWLADLAWWAEKHPEIAGVVDGVAVRERLLLARLHPLTAWTGDAAVWIPAMIKRWVYPPLWRPLRRAQRARLMAERPDLPEML